MHSAARSCIVPSMEKILTNLVASIVALIVGALCAALFIVPLHLFDAWVLAKLWAWFVVPLFGLPALSLPYAIGLGALVGIADDAVEVLAVDRVPCDAEPELPL
mgnify:CR=1 FL=1